MDDLLNVKNDVVLLTDPLKLNCVDGAMLVLSGTARTLNDVPTMSTESYLLKTLRHNKDHQVRKD